MEDQDVKYIDSLLVPPVAGADGEEPIDPTQYSSVEEVQEVMSQYWAAEEDGKKLWNTLCDKEAAFYEAVERRGLMVMSRLVYAAYFGLSSAQGAGKWQTQSIQFAGEDGELIEFSVNEIRSFYDQIVNMTCKNRPAFQAQAINTDYESLAEVNAADSTVQYYYEQVYGERKEKEVVKTEILYGKAYTHIDWDEDGGPEVEIEEPVDDPQFGEMPPVKRKVKAGEVIISKHPFWEVICEPFRSEYDEHLWRIIVPPKRSKWEMIARYPLFAKQIHDSSPDENPYEYSFPGADPMQKCPEDMVSLRIFYHAKSGALPGGRKCLFVNGIMVDSRPLPVDVIPVIPMMSCELHGTSFGISDLWNMLPLEQMQNQVLSDIATNIESFGRPPIAVEEGADMDLDSMANGQKVFFVPAGTKWPEPLKFPQVPDISFKIVEMLRAFKQSLSGLNAIARGDTSSNITSGAHAALYSQIAVEAQAPRAMELDLMREKIGNLLLMFLKKYAKHPQIVAIAGADERAYLDQFTGEDLAGVHRVVVKTANPQLRTAAGRLQLLEMLLDMPDSPVKDPAQVVEILASGQFKPAINPVRTSELRARWENEQLLKGPQVTQIPGDLDPLTGMPIMKNTVPAVPVMATDNAKLHIVQHLEVVNSPAAQKNPAVLQAVLAHILEHVDLARNGDPYLAAILGNPLPQEAMMAGAAVQQGGGAGAAAVDNAAEQVETSEDTQDDSLGASLPKPAESPVQQQN